MTRPMGWNKYTAGAKAVQMFFDTHTTDQIVAEVQRIAPYAFGSGTQTVKKATSKPRRKSKKD